MPWLNLPTLPITPFNLIRETVGFDLKKENIFISYLLNVYYQYSRIKIY
jgi:hypothetical protein